MRSPLFFLVLDDDADMRFLHRLELTKEFPGCVVAECAGVEAANALCSAQTFDAILTDYSLIDGSGTGFIARLREQGWECPILMLTGSSDPRVHEKAYAAGASRVLWGTKLRFAPIVRYLLGLKHQAADEAGAEGGGSNPPAALACQQLRNYAIASTPKLSGALE